MGCSSHIYDEAVKTLLAYKLEFPSIVWDKLGMEVYSSHQIPHILATTEEAEESIVSIIQRLEAEAN
jgi:hypothetical protein